MKIVIAPDSFKGNLSALQVAVAVERGVRRVLPAARCVRVPMADGGEGTVQSLVDALGGKLVGKRVCGPLGRPVFARYGLARRGRLAIIEMAAASGLPLVPPAQRNPLRTTTYGTGELMLDAIRRGARQIILGIGGSATNDGGAGMAQALGVRFLDRKGTMIRERACGGMLDRIRSIDMSGVAAKLHSTEVIVACDVDNPLHGRRGASVVFGPQKGATPRMVRSLDENLRHLGRLVKAQLGRDISRLRGAGAAGGLGGGLVAFAGAELRSGVDIVIAATGLVRHLRGADLVITGEGRVDFQTAFGKTPAGVARAARKWHVPVVAIGGGLAKDARHVYTHGIDALEAAIARDMTLEEALRGARGNIADAAERVLRLVLVGRRSVRRERRRQARR